MDPTILAGIKGNEVAMKLGHHVHDHGVGSDPDHKLNPATNGEVSPVTYGLSSMLKPAFWGALTLASVTLIYTAVSAAFPVAGAEAASLLSALAKNSTGLIVAGITGAIWGAGTGFYKGYTHATEHNALVQQGSDDIETARGTYRSKTIETALENAPRKGMVILGNPVGMIVQQDNTPAPLADEPPASSRPQWMQDILERGPRAANPEQTVAVSSQNGR